jgi:hypothetical protein
VRGIVPKAAWHWGGDSSDANDSFGASDSTPSCVCFTLPQGSAGGHCLIPCSFGTNTYRKKMYRKKWRRL